MQEEQDQAEATEEPTATGEAGDSAVADAVDEQAATSSGTAAEAEPEVPDDASDTIARAQEHIENLNMDEEREAAKRAM